MRHDTITRRQFIRNTIIVAGAAVIAPVGCAAADLKPAPPPVRTAADQVTLGRTGLKLSRLGIGTGTNSGEVQRALGREEFNRLIRHAYDRGITYIDTADSYKTHEWVRDAIRGIPREKLFIQTKMGGVPEKPLEVLDRFRRELDVEYVDSLLVHCGSTKNWDEERKRLLDAFVEAKEKKIIRAKGVSCHSLPALARAAELAWVDVNLVRINPQGTYVDTPAERHDAPSDASHVPAVMEQIKIMRAKGHGIIGMKLAGGGDFAKPEDREKAMRFSMQCGLLDAAVIGFKSTAEIDEAIARMNSALAATA
jgi:1-deoxyxylulose-5-phosphate synthase